jgi:alkanesulfonate monooxygenase SsuD/methylene tetrahydromethanopterin reductase-like flavin-dependent oxidoreductase (luciferase family)
MRIGTLVSDSGNAATCEPGFVVGYARHAESLGFDSIWSPDHIVSPVRYTTQYPFQDDDGIGGWRPFPYERNAVRGAASRTDGCGSGDIKA